tara:strand:+ start:2048 stop:2575 length:528 start_codon:yes stop_codon:yes gene_type:complete
LFAAGGALILAACVNPTDILSEFVQFSPNAGHFISDPDMTSELRQLEQPSYERFKVFYRGHRRDPEIIVLDIAGDRYSFDARNWKRLEGAAAMNLVRRSIDTGKFAEAVVGHETHGGILSFGIVVKELEQPTRSPDAFRYVVRFQRFGPYEITQVLSSRPKETSDTQSTLKVDGE